MIPIDNRNLIIRGGLTVLVVLSIVGAVYGGGVHALYATTQDTTTIEEYGFGQETVLTEETVRNHIVGTSSQSEYQYSLLNQTTIGTTTTELTSEKVYVSNEELRAYSEKQDNSRRDRSSETIVETETKVEVTKDNQTTVYDKTGDNTDYIEYTILENQLEQQSDIFAPYTQVSWAVTDTSEDTVTYSVSNVDPRDVSGISSISQVSGTIIVEKETGQFRLLELQLGGSSTENPGEPAVYTYRLEFPEDTNVDSQIPDLQNDE